MRLRVLLLLLLLLGLAACAGSNNVVKENYRSSLERWPSGEVARLEAPKGDVEIVTSKDIEADALRMMENGYLLLGRSKFRGKEVDPASARDVAKELGASIVFVKAEYATTVREAIPMERWTPAGRDRVAMERPTGSRAVGGAAMQGEYKVTYQRRAVDYYDTATTFWAKSKPPIFGVIVEKFAGSGTDVQSAGRGVVVRAVIGSSPASRAGILPEDIVVRFAGTEITEPDQFFATVVANKGRLVEVEVARVATSKVMKLSIQLMNE